MDASTALVFDALGDATRRAIVEELRSGRRAVGELASVLPVGRPAVSKHLRVLSDAGLVVREERGTRNLYALAEPGFAGAQQWLVALWDEALERFAAATAQEAARRGAPEAGDSRHGGGR